MLAVAGMTALNFSVNAPLDDKKKAKKEHPGANSQVGGRKQNRGVLKVFRLHRQCFRGEGGGVLMDRVVHGRGRVCI